MAEALDEFDIKILEALAKDGRMSWGDLAEVIGLSQTPTVRRVRSLEARGYIAGYHAAIDEARTGRGISVFISVSLQTQTDEALALFERRLRNLSEVMACFMMTGDTDYLLRVIVSDIEAYQGFISILTRIPGVSRITSSFAVKAIINRTAPPLPRLPRVRSR